MGAKQLDVGCAAIGMGQVDHGGAIVCQVEVQQAIDGKALTAPVYVMQDSLPATLSSSAASGAHVYTHNYAARCHNADAIMLRYATIC